MHQSQVVCSHPLAADPAAMQAFHAELTAHLYTHPTLTWNTAGQATRHGWQTGELLHDEAPVVQRLRQLLDDGVRAFQRGDGAAGGRLTARGVMLQSEGWQELHQHETAVVSGVYYVDVPAMTGPRNAGCLRFPAGVDQADTPDFIVHPSAGLLVMFPSSLWHGTVPFLAEHDRVGIAFDLYRD